MTPLPCPFCGEPIDDMGEADSDGYFARGASGSMAVECSHCQAVGPFVIRGRAPAIHAPVIAAWNTRAPARVKPLKWREIDPERRYVGTGLGFTCEVRLLHKGGWEAVLPTGKIETITCSGAMLACREAYFALVREHLEIA